MNVYTSVFIFRLKNLDFKLGTINSAEDTDSFYSALFVLFDFPKCVCSLAISAIQIVTFITKTPLKAIYGGLGILQNHYLTQ